mmetsp:Transcript_22261/g.46106  ORF Transcript_22261/g.46106 Transcript_22261/m.46106 type:complete len:107 (+) Transcript_22261:1574-1894(+)
MAPRDNDDATFDDGTFATNADGDGDDRFERAGNHAHGLLSKVFSSCEADAKGSVHRAWGITLLFIAIFFAMAFIEGECPCTSLGTVFVNRRVGDTCVHILCFLRFQ